jgi:hypothetical protein
MARIPTTPEYGPECCQLVQPVLFYSSKAAQSRSGLNASYVHALERITRGQ